MYWRSNRRLLIWKKYGKISNGYEGLYQVSDLGNIKSLERTCKSCYGATRRVKERILKPRANCNGYLMVNLYKNEQREYKVIHRMVAKVFIPNKENKAEVNHIDGNKQNNRVSNLEWCTKSENEKHAYRTGLKQDWTTGKYGKDNPMSKTVLQIDRNTGKIISQYYGTKEASKNTGISQGAISNCCTGRKYYKTAGGYKWKYKEV